MPTEGPLAQDPHAIVEIMRAAWSDHFISNQDALAVPVDFREDLFKEGVTYRIGFYTTDGYVDPLPGNQRVISEAVEMLEDRGHELVPFSMGDIVHETAMGIFGTAFADGGARAAETLKDEPMTPLMEPLRAFASMRNCTKDLGRNLMRRPYMSTQQRDG
ncbi:hypothetical protein PMAYCL1PPCAC_28075 [Pristionchus mayeri]|uniref:Amidase domain-containing protein n=1 Tax=Pristionchus mayeri TaxID=1317129 RepID=A0AAN5D929_9BILA|nr:hypothetical protein PMAYCL1PPCAC_28075 [Pristionchus mayeri]